MDFTLVDPGPGVVQIENKAICINHIDTYVRSGLYPTPSLPSDFGSEATGIVIKVGLSSAGFNAEDRVVYAKSP